MEPFTLFTMPESPHAFEKMQFSQDSYDLMDKFSLDPVDFPELYEDALTKDTNTPKELTRFEENSVSSIGVLEKKIQKIPKKSKKNTQESQAVVTKTRDKRNVKKPCHEYETTRLQEEERKKTRKITKKRQMMRETLVKPGNISTVADGPFRKNKPEESYQWRDWNMYFHQELVALAEEEFFAFLKIVHNKYPECVSFDKGYAELKMVLPENYEGLAQEGSKKLTPMVEQNLIYQLFCGCIEEVKKERGAKKVI